MRSINQLLAHFHGNSSHSSLVALPAKTRINMEFVNHMNVIMSVSMSMSV